MLDVHKHAICWFLADLTMGPTSELLCLLGDVGHLRRQRARTRRNGFARLQE